jgi:D-alanyl-D-alanine carboxypeptidase/D-alanyl-D-alanine-endopeptidase (penicillin-binding protein 4)
MKFKIYLCIAVLILSSCSNKNAKWMYKQKPAFYSYIIGNVNDNHIYTAYLPEVYTTPASCQKTVTALVALKSLGPDFRYETKLYKTKKDFLISFAGDPTLTLDNLISLLTPLKNKKIRRLILDASIFQLPTHSPNIMMDDPGKYYSQPVSAINIDKNLIHLKPQISNDITYHHNDGYKIKSLVKKTDKDSSVNFYWQGATIIAEGVFNPKDQDKIFKISPLAIEHYVLNKVKQAMRELKIKGKIIIIHDATKLPKHPILVNTIYSEKLSEIIKPALKISDNLVFDSLYLKIIHSSQTESIKKWEDGDKVIKALIKHHFNLDMNNALFVDGSGLSRYNRMQPHQLFALLKQGYHIKEFTDSLPSMGEEKSTLKDMNHLPNNIKAKTGAMSGISCLCGFGGTETRPKAFVVMSNSFAPPLKDSFEVISKFVKSHIGK